MSKFSYNELRMYLAELYNFLWQQWQKAYKKLKERMDIVLTNVNKDEKILKKFEPYKIKLARPVVVNEQAPFYMPMSDKDVQDYKQKQILKERQLERERQKEAKKQDKNYNKNNKKSKSFSR